MAKYPNLGLIEERFKQVIRKEHKVVSDNSFSCDVFRQTFPNTAGIFENGGISGQMFIHQYITVMYCDEIGLYGVFGDEELAYLVDAADATQKFFGDLRNREMEVTRMALVKYPAVMPRKEAAY